MKHSEEWFKIDWLNLNGSAWSPNLRLKKAELAFQKFGGSSHKNRDRCFDQNRGSSDHRSIEVKTRSSKAKFVKQLARSIRIRFSWKQQTTQVNVTNKGHVFLEAKNQRPKRAFLCKL